MKTNKPASPGTSVLTGSESSKISENSTGTKLSSKRKKDDDDLKAGKNKKATNNKEEFEFIGRDDAESRKKAIIQMNEFSKMFGFKDVPDIKKPYSDEEKKQIRDMMYKAKG